VDPEIASTDPVVPSGRFVVRQIPLAVAARERFEVGGVDDFGR
jgi:hypothetical protein